MILRNGNFSGKILRKIFHLTSLAEINSFTSALLDIIMQEIWWHAERKAPLCLIKHHDMKAYAGGEKFHVFLNTSLDGGRRSASRPG
jgi:hypothetical protein